MATPKGRILCTEDDEDTRDLLQIVLSQAGYKVVCTSNTDDAIQFAHTQHFDLFLVDNWVATTSGPDFTRKLREFDVKTPVLFYSGAAHQSYRDNARLAGAQGYLVKPVPNEDLIREVARLIAENKIAEPVNVVVPHGDSKGDAFIPVMSENPSDIKRIIVRGRPNEDTPIFHLVDRPTGRTVCGLDASNVRLKWKAALNWMPDQQLETICTDCIRLSEQNPPQ